MLSLADRGICERDLAVPGLRLLLDAQALATALGCGPLTPAYLRYKPGISCVASYLCTDGQALAAYAYYPERYEEESRRSRWRREPSVTLLPDDGVIVVPARLDRHLRAAGRFLDPVALPDHLRRLAGGDPDLATGDLTLLRYKPGRRLVARLDVQGRPRAVLKIMAGSGFDRALIGATAAMAHGQAPLLGAEIGSCAILTAWVPGRPVCPEMTGHPPERATVQQIGAALATLHASPFRPAADLTTKGDGDALGAAAADLMPLDPVLAARAHDLAATLSHRLDAAAFAPTLVHGDFSADQVVIGADGPVILDWDNAARGDPARDLGSCLARMDAQVLDGVLTRACADDLGAALLQGYGRRPATLALHHARALMLLVTEGFRARIADWPGRTDRLLDRVAQVLRGPVAPVDDAGMPSLAAALDPAYALPALRVATGLDIVAVRPELMRHKPGRRALIRYATKGSSTGPEVILGKLRAKGTDSRMPALHDALRRAGLDGRAAHGTGVPRPRGTIEAMGLWLQDQVPGRALSPDDGVAMRRTGAALAHLHAVPPVTDRRWSHADEMSVLDRALTGAAQDMPHHAAALRAIRQGASDALAGLGPAPDRGIHRDFYFDQVLIDDHAVWLVDLDLYAVGDPAIDLGNFLAHLDEFALRTTGDAAALQMSAQAFLDGYAAVTALPDPHRVRVMRRVSLARHIAISTRFPDRRHITAALITLSLDAPAGSRPS